MKLTDTSLCPGMDEVCGFHIKQTNKKKKPTQNKNQKKKNLREIKHFQGFLLFAIVFLTHKR